MMKYIVKLIDIISHGILLLFMLLVIVTALLSSLFRYYLPNIDEHREVLLEAIEEYTGGIQVSADKISSSWDAFRPELNLYGVSVKKEGWENTLKLDKLSLEINFIQSFLNRTLYFERIEMANLDLLVVQSADGRWSLTGVSEGKKTPLNIERMLDQIWAIDKLVLHNIQLILQ